MSLEEMRRELSRRFEALKGLNPGLRPGEEAICEDILDKLSETGQPYIVSHDFPVSISAPVFRALDRKRQELASSVGVPEEQFEFEDAVSILTDLIPLETYRSMVDRAKLMRGSK